MAARIAELVKEIARVRGFRNKSTADWYRLQDLEIELAALVAVTPSHELAEAA